MARTVWWEGWPSRDRPLYLELREIDEANGVAIFDYSTDSATDEVWVVTVEGYMHDPDILDSLMEDVVGAKISASTIEIPLSSKVQTTKIEVWDAALDSGVGYLIQTVGINPKQFRYVINAEASSGLLRGYLVEESTEVYRLSSDISEATHTFGLVTLGGSLVDAVALGTDTKGLRTVVENDTRMRIYEA